MKPRFLILLFLIAVTLAGAQNVGAAGASPAKEASWIPEKAIPELAIGGNSSGGGDAVVCTHDPIFTFFRSVYLADVFGLSHHSKAPFKQFDGRTGTEIYKIIRDRLEKVGTESSQKILAAYESLKLILVSRSLPELDDDNIASKKLYPGCYKKQLAIQDREHGLVYASEDLYNALGSVETELFRLHEALVAVKGYGPDNTHIRQELRELLKTLEIVDPNIRMSSSPLTREESIRLRNLTYLSLEKSYNERFIRGTPTKGVGDIFIRVFNHHLSKSDLGLPPLNYNLEGMLYRRCEFTSDGGEIRDPIYTSECIGRSMVDLYNLIVKYYPGI